MLKYLLVSFAVLTLVSAGEKYMVFEKPPSNLKVLESIAVLQVEDKNVEWYASWPTKYVVKLFVGTGITLKFHCTVNDLEKKHAMTQIKYCFNKQGAPENCKILVKGQITEEMNVIVGSSSPKAVLTFNPITGGLATIADVPLTADVSTDFYCSMSSDMGTVTSNIVRIIDWRSRGDVISINYPKEKLYRDGPLRIPCEGEASSSKPIPKEIALSYKWKTCSNEDWRKCDYANIGGTTVQILNDGTLYIPYFTNGMVTQFTNQFINCFIDAKQRSRSTKRMTFHKTGTSPGRITELKIVAPVKSGTPLGLINTRDEITRYCNFEIGPGAVDVKWFKEDNGKRTLLTATNSGEYKVKFEKYYGITFQGLYNERTPGKYICVVSWTPEDGSGTQTKDASYDVSIKYYPETSRDLVPKLYVMNGKNGTVNCSFVNPFKHDENAGNKVKPSLEVNGVSLNLKNQADFDVSVQTLNYQFSDSMANLKLSVTPLDPQPSDSLIYTALDMKESDELMSKPSTHMLTCIGKNTLGSVRKNVLLQVVPKLEFLIYPSNTNCTACLAEFEHEFKCVVKNLQKYNVTSTHVIINQYWKIGDIPVINRGNNFVGLSSDNTTLTVKNMTDRKDIETFNKEYGKITCVVTMSYPPGMQIPIDLKRDAFDREIFYSSSDDPVISGKLFTQVKLVDRPVAAANLTWVIALSLSLLVLLIVVVLIIVWLQRRPPAETYDVDRTEKQQGNDPDAENKRKEAFPQYERAEEGPIQGRRMSLDGSIDIASDDEDLAEYEAEIGEFNEQASFIGEYDERNATNRRPSASNV